MERKDYARLADALAATITTRADKAKAATILMLLSQCETRCSHCGASPFGANIYRGLLHPGLGICVHCVRAAVEAMRDTRGLETLKQLDAERSAERRAAWEKLRDYGPP
jgi:hypothetical protein